MKNKITLIFTLTFILLSLSFVSSAHYINGFVENALDGTNPEGMKITMWKTGESPAINITGTIGLSGSANYPNMYMIDCEMLPEGCNLGTNLSLKVYDNGSGYYTDVMTHLATGAGYSVANNLTLQKKSGILIKTLYPPSSPWVTNQSKINLSYSIYSDEPITKITHSWNDVNTTLYDESLVLFMNFDKRSELGENDTFVRDLSLYGNNGTVVGGDNVTWTENGKYGGAYEFSGDLGNINVGIFNVGYEFTVTGWIKAGSGDIRTIISDSINSSNRFFQLFLNNANKLYVYYTPLKSGEWWVVSDDPSKEVNLEEWTHFTLVGSNESGRIIIYQNGIVVSNSSLHEGFKRTGSIIQFNIGSHYGISSIFNGSIDEVMAFNRTLSSEEIMEIYESQITKYNESSYEFNINKKIENVGNSILFINDIGSEKNEVYKVDTISIGYNNSKGKIKDFFYGVSNYLKFFSVDAEVMPYFNKYTDYEWNRQKFLESGMTNTKQRVYLNDIFNGSSKYEIGIKNQTQLDYIKQEADWNKINGNKFIVNIVDMPTYLQDRDSTYCNSSSWSSCPPNNYTAYADLVVFLMDYVTDSGSYRDVALEILNEPYGTGASTNWLNTLGYDHIDRGIEYVKLYNTTRNKIKSDERLSYIEVIGPSGHMAFSPNLMKTFISNMTTDIDGISIHPYSYSSVPSETQVREINSLLGNCTLYGAKCDNIYLSEWNVGSIAVTNNTDNFKDLSAIVSNSYIQILNNYPSNITSQLWKWSVTSNFSREDYIYYLVLQPELIYPSPWFPQYNAVYNVTKDFAHLCPAGAEVYETSSDSDEIKQVSCKKDDLYSLILINTVNESKNITLDLDGNYPYSNIINYQDGDIYKLNLENEVNLGVIDGYDVVYLYSGFGHELKGLYSLNENTGNKVYDKLKISNSGTISGATWENDEELIDLSSGEYTLDKSKGIFTFINTNYLYSYLLLSYDYKKIFGFHVSILELISGFLTIVILGIAIIYVSKYIQNLKEVE